MPEAGITEIYNFPPWINKSKLYASAVVIATLIGLFMSITHTFIYPLFIKTRNLILSIVLRFLVFLTLTLSTLFLFYQFSGLSGQNFSQSISSRLRSSFIDVFIYLVMIELVIGLTITLRRNLGNTYLSKLIRHAYFNPKEEYRVFMFTDMKNSTALVENMGSVFFSRLIQECFRDFSSIALAYGAEVYQFVGDEVVTTWKVKEGFDFASCLSLHYTFCKRLHDKKSMYLDSFDTYPEFRSSIHCGKVSVALVGEYKSSIAYHGVTLNLCSRLQSVGRRYAADLVVSESFYNHLTFKGQYSFQALKDIQLKGVVVKQLVYTVIKINQQ